MAMEEQQLFLMEFLVDKVNIPAVRAIHDEMLPVVTCVSFQILSLPRIDIFQDAPTSGCSCNEGDVQTFRKGKSCLFALPTIVLQKPISSFPITMCVYKKLPPGVLPDVMLIGSHQIQGKYIMNALLCDRAFNGGNPSKATKDTFKITTATGQCVGEVTLFVRVSCFGKKIVTQFQIPHNQKPYLFKGAEDSPVFQCKRIPSKMQQRPAPSCTCCPLKRVTDGSGEAMRTCCSPNAARSSAPNNLYEPRPCCPARQASPNVDGRNRQQSRGPQPTTAGKSPSGQSPPYCPPCCAQGPSADSIPLCQQSSYVPAPQRSSKSSRCPPPPCCPPPMCPPPPCCQPPKCPPPPCPPCPPPRCPPPPCPPCPPPSCPPPKCQPCCPPSQCRLGCPPPHDVKDFISLITKEPKLRKCGCVVKEDLGCCCGRK